MKKATLMLKIVPAALFVFSTGCTKPSKPDYAAMQGSWQGQETGATAKGSPSLLVSGANFEFHGADTNEWYKATLTLREDTKPKQCVVLIKECPFPAYVGKTANGIYRFDAGTLTITANEPGSPAIPAGFGAPGARTFVFKSAGL